MFAICATASTNIQRPSQIQHAYARDMSADAGRSRQRRRLPLPQIRRAPTQPDEGHLALHRLLFVASTGRGERVGSISSFATSTHTNAEARCVCGMNLCWRCVCVHNHVRTCICSGVMFAMASVHHAGHAFMKRQLAVKKTNYAVCARVQWSAHVATDRLPSSSSRAKTSWSCGVRAQRSRSPSDLPLRQSSLLAGASWRCPPSLALRATTS